MSFTPLLGLKLDSDFSHNPIWQKVFTGISEPLRVIADLGLKTVEFSIEPDFETDQMKFLLDECSQYGLKVNFHPYSKGEYNPACFQDREGNLALETSRKILELSHQASLLQNRKTVLIFHGASTVEAKETSLSGATRNFFLERTNHFFKWLESYTETKKLNVLIVSELQIANDSEDKFFRIGDSYTEVLQTIKDTNLGICWDTGHNYFDHLRNRISLIPPVEFVKKVQHIHLHDVQNGEDHQPLSAGTIPLTEYLTLLQEADFSGDITLEFSPLAIAASGKFEEVIKNSIRKIRP